MSMLPTAPGVAPAPIPRRTWNADRANPLLVRVVRQELRSRTFLSIFVLLLSGATIAAMIVAAMNSNHTNADFGPGFFGVIACAWTFALGVAQPIACFRSIANERNDDTWDLVELTGMRPISVVLGLLWASVVQGLLYTAALAPFMVMAYLLRGLDLAVILFVLCIVPLGSFALCCLAVFTASLSNHKAVRATLGALLGLYLIFQWFGLFGLWFNLEEIRSFIDEIGGMGHEKWLVIGPFSNLWGAGVAVLLVLAGTLLSHRARDRSFGPRFLWWVLWLNILAWPVGVLVFSDFARREGSAIIIFVGVFLAVWALVLGFFSVSEDYELSPRQARAITDPPRWRAWLTWCLGPGAARGRLCYLAMTWLTVAVVGFANLFHTSPDEYFAKEITQFFAVIAALVSWGGIILLLSDTLARGILKRWFDTAVLRRGATLLVTAVFCLLPVLTTLLLFGNEIEDTYLVYLSPVTTFMQVGSGFSYNSQGVIATPVSFVIFCGVGLLAQVTLLIQGLRLRITTTRILARDGDHNPRGG